MRAGIPVPDDFEDENAEDKAFTEMWEKMSDADKATYGERVKKWKEAFFASYSAPPIFPARIIRPSKPQTNFAPDAVDE